MLSLGLWRRRVFFLAWLGDRSILGLRISFFSLGLYFLCLSCSFLDLGSISGLWEGLGPLALNFFFGPMSALILITSLARSFWTLKEGESSLGSRGLLWKLKSSGRRRWEGNRDFTDLGVVVYIPWFTPLRVYRDSCKVEGFCPCYHIVIPAYFG